MFEKRNPMFIFMIPVVIMGVILLAWSITTLSKDVDEIKSTLAENDAIENIREGEIVDKLIVNSQTKANTGGGVVINNNGGIGYGIGIGGSQYIPMEYQFVVKGEYEYNGEKKTGERKIQVSEAVYNSYKIGEHFDSRDLKAADSSAAEKMVDSTKSVEGVQFRVGNNYYYTDEHGKAYDYMN